MLPLPFSRPVPCLRLLAAAALAGWLLPASPVQADCAQVGSDVTCTATDTDGFGDGTQDDLIVSVEPGASVTNADGVDVINLNDGNTVTVQSTGGVTATGANADAIVAGNDNTVTNLGTITVLGDGGAGISIGDGGAVNNRGTILGGTPAMPALNVVGIRVGNGTTELPNPDPLLSPLSLNANQITLFGDNSIGIDIGTNVITNPLTNRGIVRATGMNAIGVRLGTGNDFSNFGSILVDGEGSRGIVSNGVNSILNLNNIDVSGMDSLAIFGSGSVETVDNQGRIEGDIDLAGGDDLLRLYSGSILIAPNSVSGGADTDALELLGTGSGFLDLDPVMDFETLLIDGGGRWELSGGADFTSTTLQDGTLLLRDTVNLGGDYEQADGTTLLVLVEPGGANGLLDVDGNVVLGMDTNLAVFPTNPILSDTTITVLMTTGTITGGFANIPADTAVLRFRLDTSSPDRIDLEILRASYASLAGTPNQRAVGSYLDRVLLGSPSADVNFVLVQLDTLPAESLRDAFDQLHPEAYDAHTGALAAVGYTLAGIAARERLWCKPPLSELRPGRYQEEPCGRNGYSVWLDAVTGVHDRDTGSDWLESDGSTQALLAGVDWRPDRRVVVSGWAGLSSVDLDMDDAGEGDLDTFEFGVSTLARLGGARVRAALGYGRGSHEQDRAIRFGPFDLVARGEYDSNRVLGLLDLGWLFELGGFSIEPQAALDVAWVQEEAFDEEGVGDLGLAVDERSNTLVSTAFGARLAYRHVQRAYVDPGPSWTQGVWTPEITGRWRSTWTGADREIDANLLGVPDSVGGFTTEARDTEQGAELGARLTFHPHGGGGSVSVGYDGYFGDGGTAHRAGVELRLHF